MIVVHDRQQQAVELASGYGAIALPKRPAGASMRCDGGWLTYGTGPRVAIKDLNAENFYRTPTGDGVEFAFVVKSSDGLAPGDYTLWYSFAGKVAQIGVRVPDTPFNVRSKSFKRVEETDDRLLLSGSVTIPEGTSIDVPLSAPFSRPARLGISFFHDNAPIDSIKFTIAVFEPEGFRVIFENPSHLAGRMDWVIY